MGVLEELFAELGYEFSLLIPYYVFSMLLSVGAYVVQGIGLYKIAAKCGSTHPWFSFIPFCNIYLIGEICGVLPVGGKIFRNPAKLLLGLYLGLFVGMFVILFATVLLIVSMYDGGGAGLALLLLFASLALLALSITNLVFMICAYLRIFRLFDYRNATLYTIVSIFVSFTFGIFLWMISKYNPYEYLRLTPDPNHPGVPPPNDIFR